MPTPERSPGFKLGMAILVGLMLSIPLFTVWLLVYDRQLQSEQAQQSIAEGWGGPQLIAGPVLVIPYRDDDQRDGDRERPAGDALARGLAGADPRARAGADRHRDQSRAALPLDLRGGGL